MRGCRVPGLGGTGWVAEGSWVELEAVITEEAPWSVTAAGGGVLGRRVCVSLKLRSSRKLVWRGVRLTVEAAGIGA